MRVLVLATVFIISSRSVSIRALIVLELAKGGPGPSLKIRYVIFKPWKVLQNQIDYHWNTYCYDRWMFRKVLVKAMQNWTLQEYFGRAQGPGECIFRLSESLKFKIWQPWCHRRDILGLLRTSCFELLRGWNVCKLKSMNPDRTVLDIPQYKNNQLWVKNKNTLDSAKN